MFLAISQPILNHIWWFRGQEIHKYVHKYGPTHDGMKACLHVTNAQISLSQSLNIYKNVATGNCTNPKCGQLQLEKDQIVDQFSLVLPIFQSYKLDLQILLAWLIILLLMLLVHLPPLKRTFLPSLSLWQLLYRSMRRAWGWMMIVICLLISIIDSVLNQQEGNTYVSFLPVLPGRIMSMSGCV